MYIFCLACTGAELFLEDKICGEYKHVNGSLTEATNTFQKCNDMVLNECTYKDYFSWRESNNACHCAEETNCDSPKSGYPGLNIYQTCTPGKLRQFKKVTKWWLQRLWV